MVQAAVIAVILGFMFRDTPGDATASVWPYALAAYGALAAVVPWLTGNFVDVELTLRQSCWMAVLFALPLAVAGWLLGESPYRAIGAGCWILAALWPLHLLVVSALHVRKRMRGGDKA